MKGRGGLCGLVGSGLLLLLLGPGWEGFTYISVISVFRFGLG
jgi:hypothetical protein